MRGLQPRRKFDHDSGRGRQCSIRRTGRYADLFLSRGRGHGCTFSKRGLTHKAYGWRGLRNKRYTYVITNGYTPDEPQRELLYDRELDPYEMNPLEVEKDCADVRILAFRERLKHYLELTEDPFLWDRVRDDTVQEKKNK